MAFYLPFFTGFAVLADSLNALAVGAPAVPGLRIFSPEPALMRSRLAWMLAYRPGLVATFFSLLFTAVPAFERGFRARGVAFGVGDDA